VTDDRTRSGLLPAGPAREPRLDADGGIGVGAATRPESITYRHVWDDRLCLGVREIDSEHRALFHHLEKLTDEHRAAWGVVDSADAMEHLIGDARYCFTREEVLMWDYDYPDVEAHRREHAEWIADLEQLEARFLAGGSPGRSSGSLRILGRRLAKHIDIADRGYIVFFRSKVPSAK